MEMPSIDGYTVTRRELLRYGAGGAATLALGAMPSASLASSGARRATPKKGGTLKFARSVAPTSWTRLTRSSPAMSTRWTRSSSRSTSLPDGTLHAVLATELHGQQGRQDVHLQPPPRRQVLRRLSR